jgi:hypothetical protein
LGRVSIISWAEFLSEAGADSTIVDGASDLEQKIGSSSRPAHLLRLAHPAVHQNIGPSDRGANPQFGTVPFRVMNQPIALTGEISIQRAQAGPQVS